MYAHWIITRYTKRLTAVLTTPLQISALYWTAVAAILEPSK